MKRHLKYERRHTQERDSQRMRNPTFRQDALILGFEQGSQIQATSKKPGCPHRSYEKTAGQDGRWNR